MKRNVCFYLRLFCIFNLISLLHIFKGNIETVGIILGNSILGSNKSFIDIFENVKILTNTIKSVLIDKIITSDS